jgi:hypothetical protein
LSVDGETWTSSEGDWMEVSAENPWDGSGTEIVTTRTPVTEATPMILGRIKIESPL